MAFWNFSLSQGIHLPQINIPPAPGYTKPLKMKRNLYWDNLKCLYFFGSAASKQRPFTLSPVRQVLQVHRVEKIHDGFGICIISNAIFVKTGLEKLIITRFPTFRGGAHTWVPPGADWIQICLDQRGYLVLSQAPGLIPGSHGVRIDLA